MHVCMLVALEGVLAGHHEQGPARALHFREAPSQAGLCSREWELGFLQVVPGGIPSSKAIFFLDNDSEDATASLPITDLEEKKDLGEKQETGIGVASDDSSSSSVP